VSSKLDELSTWEAIAAQYLFFADICCFMCNAFECRH